MAEHFNKWHFEVTWKWNCDDVFIVSSGVEIPIGELYFNTEEIAEKCLAEHEVLLFKYDEDGNVYPFGRATVEYDCALENPNYGYYVLTDGVLSRAHLELRHSSFTLF